MARSTSHTAAACGGTSEVRKRSGVNLFWVPRRTTSARAGRGRPTFTRWTLSCSRRCSERTGGPAKGLRMNGHAAGHARSGVCPPVGVWDTALSPAPEGSRIRQGTEKTQCPQRCNDPCDDADDGIPNTTVARVSSPVTDPQNAEDQGARTQQRQYYQNCDEERVAVQRTVEHLHRNNGQAHSAQRTTDERLDVSNRVCLPKGLVRVRRGRPLGPRRWLVLWLLLNVFVGHGITLPRARVIARSIIATLVLRMIRLPSSSYSVFHRKMKRDGSDIAKMGGLESGALSLWTVRIRGAS
jgi:hypothetical protein